MLRFLALLSLLAVAAVPAHADRALPHAGCGGISNPAARQACLDRAAHAPHTLAPPQESPAAEAQPPPASPPPLTIAPVTTALPTKHIADSVYASLIGRGAEAVQYPGYGLYTYVLIPSRSPRATTLVQGIFATTNAASETQIPRAELDLMLLPAVAVDSASAPPAPPPVPDAADFVQRRYDFALAKDLLALFCAEPAADTRRLCAGSLSDGPYLFTFTGPVSDRAPTPPPYLLVDLTLVHEHAFREFIDAYKAQVKRTDFTDRQRIDTFRLRFASIVLTAADWADQVEHSVFEIMHEATGGAGE